MLSKEGDVFYTVEQLFTQYKQDPAETKFKKLVIDEHEALTRHYKKRDAYKLSERIRAREKERALAVSKQALLDFRANKFKSAASLYLEIIKIYSCYALKNEPALALAYYNCGRSLHSEGLYQEALFYIKTSLILRENYIQPKPQADIDKTKKAIEECEVKLREPLPNRAELSGARV